MHLPPPVRVALAPSPYACGCIAFGAIVTAMLLVILPIDPVLIGLGLCALIAWSCDRILVVALRRGPRAVHEIVLSADRLIVVRTGQDRLTAGYVRDATYVGARITTVVWRPDAAWRSRAELILPDMLPAEDFRRLRVQLRYGRDKETAAAKAGLT